MGWHGVVFGVATSSVLRMAVAGLPFLAPQVTRKRNHQNICLSYPLPPHTSEPRWLGDKGRLAGRGGCG